MSQLMDRDRAFIFISGIAFAIDLNSNSIHRLKSYLKLELPRLSYLL